MNNRQLIERKHALHNAVHQHDLHSETTEIHG